MNLVMQNNYEISSQNYLFQQKKFTAQTMLQ